LRERKRFLWELTEEEVTEGIHAFMRKTKLRSGSIAGIYSIYEAIYREWKKAIEWRERFERNTPPPASSEVVKSMKGIQDIPDMHEMKDSELEEVQIGDAQLHSSSLTSLFTKSLKRECIIIPPFFPSLLHSRFLKNLNRPSFDERNIKNALLGVKGSERFNFTQLHYLHYGEKGGKGA